MANILKRPTKEDSPIPNGHNVDYSDYQRSVQPPQKHPLYNRGVCSWSSCDTSCETMGIFLAHLNREHLIDEKSTAQTRVQVCCAFVIRNLILTLFSVQNLKLFLFNFKRESANK